MSMFYELMMRKKEQIMYATIKGTLTENDGVFSGFSASNYLLTQDYISIDNTSNIEIVTKINISNYQDVNALLSTNTRYGFYLRINYTNHILCYLGNGSSFNIANGVAGSNTLDNDKTYYIKIKISNGSFSIMISEDNQTYITDNTFDISSLTTTQQYRINFGVGRNTSNYFRGSIDLNNSYIKLGSTKYNLQAVVGYTVVGSPTIVDGVVSGFINTGENYLKLDNASVISSADTWEICLKCPTVSGSYCIGTDKLRIITLSLGSSRLSLSSDSSNWDIASGIGTGNATPTNSYIRIRFTGTKYIYDYSADRTNWVVCAEVNSSTKIYAPSYLRIGAWWTGYSYTTNFTGSIDLNETYIKINNKLWFNGQQA